MKLWGAGYGIHRGRLGSNAYFEEGIGRQPGLLLGGEDTDLCVRAVGMGLESLYNPSAVVEHQVLPERISYRWLMRRFYYSGVERAMKADSLQPSVEGRVFMDRLIHDYPRSDFVGQARKALGSIGDGFGSELSSTN